MCTNFRNFKINSIQNKTYAKTHVVADVHVVFAAFKPKDELPSPELPYFSKELMTKVREFLRFMCTFVLRMNSELLVLYFSNQRVHTNIYILYTGKKIEIFWTRNFPELRYFELTNSCNKYM